MNDELLQKLVPGILSALQGVAASREVLAKTLNQLANEVLEGKHIPEAALQRANEDQQILDKLFD